MSRHCRRIRRTLEEVGPRGLSQDTKAQEHLADCDACFEVLEAAGRLDAALGALEPIDGPDEAVEQLLTRVREDEPQTQAARGDSPFAKARRVFPWTAGGIDWLRVQGPRRVQLAAAAAVVVMASAGGMVLWLGVDPEPDAFTVGDLKLRQLRFELPQSAVDAPEGREDLSAPLERRGNREPEELRSKEKKLQAELEALGYLVGSPEPERLTVTSESPLVDLSEADVDVIAALEFGSVPPMTNYLNLPTGPGKAPGEKAGAGGNESGQRLLLKDQMDARQSEVGAWIAEVDKNEGRVGGLAGVELRYRDSLEAADQLDADVAPSEDAIAAARAFLAERSRLESLIYQQATGYWSNQYVPGDPAFRLLQSRLLGRQRAALESHSGSPLALHDAAHQAVQPFDPPENAAMAVYLQADRSRLDEPGRMLLQVGLQATERRSGRRPALNLAVVLDLRGELDTATATAFRALAVALEDRRDLGDRFQLLVAGRPGGLLVGPGEFRHGPLAVALEQALGVGGSAAPTLDLHGAMTLAMSEVLEADDPTSPLGSSGVLLVTASSLGANLPSLERLAHESAVAGVPVSVVGVGSQVERRELDRIALMGQGNRRLMTAPAEAADLVDRELSAVGRLVARALRLRIRLAPGVELVDVLGSRQLDAARAQAVREAEMSLDLRMARDLGIEADRGEDEEGIQIVIPNFYAGDAHVVLLDVVAPGPGPVADVTVRYKDLVHLRNGVARDHLTLARGESQIEPLGLNVFKNLLAFDLYESLERAGSQLASGDTAAAVETLREAARLIEGLRHEVAGLVQDRDLASDVAMLEEYLSVLSTGAASEPSKRQHLVDSLRLAGRLKILPQPVVDR